MTTEVLLSLSALSGVGNNIKGRSGIYLQLLSPYHAVQLPAIANLG